MPEAVGKRQGRVLLQDTCYQEEEKPKRAGTEQVSKKWILDRNIPAGFALSLTSVSAPDTSFLENLPTSLMN